MKNHLTETKTCLHTITQGTHTSRRLILNETDIIDARCISSEPRTETAIIINNQCISIIMGSQFVLCAMCIFDIEMKWLLIIRNVCLKSQRCCCWLFLSYIWSKYLRCCIHLENGSMHPIPTIFHLYYLLVVCISR